MTLPDAPLNELPAFAAVAEAGSFRASATRLGVTPSAVSHSLRTLEARLGMRLLHRTPRTAAHLVLMPLLARFLASHPGMAVELSCDEALVDIVAAGFDAGLRFGESLQGDMVALPVGAPQRFAVVAAPAYLARHGTPRTPAELMAHACIRLRFPSGRLYGWEFVAPDGRGFEVQVAGSFTANWDGTTASGDRATQGTYTVCIESAVEHGSESLIRQQVTFGASSATTALTDSGQLSAASVAYTV